MLPYMAQSANSSLEDGATVGALLSQVKQKDQISAAMAMYDSTRRPRIDQLVQETFKQGKEHHLADGPEQDKRDLLLSKSFEKPANGEKTWYVSPVDANYWESLTDLTGRIPKFNRTCAYAEVEKAYSLHPF